MSIDKILQKSYESHKQGFAGFVNGNDSHSKTWFNENTIDYWRHWRMYLTIKPILEYFNNTNWMTIGDGRYGLDSVRLKKINNTINVLPTDISPYLLEESKKMGIISDFSIENAEKLSFKDDQFDFTFCKEAFHHLPRPFLCVYEMLRVSKKGIVFIEPNDRLTNPPIILSLINKLVLFKSKILGKTKPHPDTGWFEEDGNYCYFPSLREIEKLAIGIQLPCIAFKYTNDYYEKGLEYTNTDRDIETFNKVKKKIRSKDNKCKIGLRQPDLITIIIFKEMPADELKQQMRNNGLEVVDLPICPY